MVTTRFEFIKKDSSEVSIGFKDIMILIIFENVIHHRVQCDFSFGASMNESFGPFFQDSTVSVAAGHF